MALNHWDHNTFHEIFIYSTINWLKMYKSMVSTQILKQLLRSFITLKNMVKDLGWKLNPLIFIPYNK